jgi:hypothetical protein
VQNVKNPAVVIGTEKMIGLVLARNRVLGCSWSIVVEYRVMREGF